MEEPLFVNEAAERFASQHQSDEAMFAGFRASVHRWEERKRAGRCPPLDVEIRRDPFESIPAPSPRSWETLWKEAQELKLDQVPYHEERESETRWSSSRRTRTTFTSTPRSGRYRKPRRAQPKRVPTRSRKVDDKELYDAHEAKCKLFFAKERVLPEIIRFEDIPWPALGSFASVGAFLFQRDASRARYRELCLRWHPDRFMQRFGGRLDKRDKEKIADQVLVVAQGVIAHYDSR